MLLRSKFRALRLESALAALTAARGLLLAAGGAGTVSGAMSSFTSSGLGPVHVP